MTVEPEGLKEVLNYIEKMKRYDSIQSYHLAAISELAWIFLLSFAGVMAFLLQITNSVISDGIPWFFGSFGGAILSLYIFSTPTFISEETNRYTGSVSNVMKFVVLGIATLWIVLALLVFIIGPDFTIPIVTLSVGFAHLYFKRRAHTWGDYGFQQFIFFDSHWIFLVGAAILDIVLYFFLGSIVVPYFSLLFPLAYSSASVLNILIIRKQIRVQK